MADSANILSILASLGSGQAPSGPPTNVLQQVAPPDTGASPQPQAPPAPSPADIAQAATTASPPMPRARHSLIDTIGRISDVLATVGGAHALYQPTLDAREDRTLALGDHARQVDLEGLKKTLEEQQVAAGALQPQIDARKRLGVALGALDGQSNAADLWPSIAEQAGIDAQHTAAIGQLLQANPSAAGILAKSLGADPNNLGKNVFFGTNTDGKTVAYQVGPDGKPHVLDFGAAGITPNTPIKVVDTGGSNVIVGQNGQPLNILPNSASPNAVTAATTSRENNRDTNQTALTIAGMPARAKAAGDAKASDPQAGLKIISDIQQGFDNLHGLKALPGEGGAVGNMIGAVGRTALGQSVEAKTGLSSAAQERELLAKNLANLQSDLIKTLPGNATRTRFEQEIQKKRLPDPTTMNYATANRAIGQIREAYVAALRAQQAATPKTAPANNGWTVVGVK